MVTPTGQDGQETGTRYAVKGLQTLDRMPVVFRGERYDVANLSEQELTYLRQFPEAFPYLTESE
ncbi:hypothetical protein GCM10027291_41710 [Telluribacter humicola]|uniref:hypothetical protein n=1 Tax=Telluribacter humicola TaxID=1720261 RepID=UPI001A96C93E|nr:hypothetical protein [Telluribacter humicola]